MRTSQLYLPTLKEAPADAEINSHQLMIRGALIRKLAAGIYTWLPLGIRVLRKVEKIIREELDQIGAQEFFMPMVQPGELWKETGRWQQYGSELLRFQDRHQRDFCLGPTHEEVVTDLIRREVRTYRQLPLIFYQIQTKFRDEIRPRFGVMRGREFLMKDAYSFHATQACLDNTYQSIYQAYLKIFNRLGLAIKVVEADTGNIGGHTSHEFQVLSDVGEDVIVYSTQNDYAANQEIANQAFLHQFQSKDAEQFKQARGIEVGHIFQLGIKYSEPMGAQITTRTGELSAMEMGCYGIGVSRIVAAAIEQTHDNQGMKWTSAMAPFQVVIIPIGYQQDQKVKNTSDDLYKKLQAQNVEVLLEDRIIRPGVSFTEMDLLGIPHRLVVSQTTLANAQVEYKKRSEKAYTIQLENILEVLMSFL